MKKSLLLMNALLMGSLWATELTVNQPYEEVITDAAKVTIATPPTIGADTLLVLNAKVLFTVPSETPDYNEVTAEKLALAADTDGKILIADGASATWVKTTVITDEVNLVEVLAEGKVQDGKLVFTVKLNGGKAYTVTSPASGTSLARVETEGEGTVSDLSLALVDTAIFPGGTAGEGVMTPELLQQYMSWVNGVLKGKMPNEAGVLPTGVSAEDAFVMNVDGKPELKIVAVDPVGGTITLEGTSTKGDVTATVSLDNINGKIYISWTSSLDGEVSVTEAVVQERDAERFILAWPHQDARFIKAAVSREAPIATTSL